MVKRGRGFNTYRPSAKRMRFTSAVGTAAKFAVRAGGSYLRNKLKKRSTDNVTTGQFDYRTQYVKKRMPYKKKRRWVRQVKINQALDLKSAGLKTVLYNSTITRNVAGNIGQECINFCLYGIKGLDDTATLRAGYRDVYRIFKNEPTIQKYVSGEPKGGKIHFQSAVLDVTLRNTGSIDVEVDVYFGYHYKNPSGQNGDLYSGYFDDSAPPIAAGNTNVTINSRGATPFDLTEQTAIQRFTVKKKQKFYLPVGKSVFIQHRDPKNRTVDWEAIQDFPENSTSFSIYAKPWMTYDCLVVYKKVVGTAEGLGYEVSAGVTRKYSYSILSGNTDAQALNP